MGEIKRWNHYYDGFGDYSHMAGEHDGDYVLYTDHAEAMREKDAEIERYRQAIWDARSILGFDNDGEPTPVALTFPHMADMLVREATEFRADYDEANRECLRAEAQRDALLAAGAPLANAAYNLAQMPKLGEHERASLDVSCQRWDKEVDGIRQQGT